MARMYQPQLGAQIQQGISNLGDMFAPPSAQDAYLSAKLKADQAAVAHKQASETAIRNGSLNLADFAAAGITPDMQKAYAMADMFARAKADPNLAPSALDASVYATGLDAGKTFAGESMKPIAENATRAPAATIADALGIPRVQTGVIQTPQGGTTTLPAGAPTGAAVQGQKAMPSGAAGAPHVIQNRLVDPTGKVLFEAPEKSSSLPQETIDFMAERGLRGDTSWVTGLGRGAQGSENIAAVQTRMAQLQKERSQTPQDMLDNIAGFGGQKAGARAAGSMAGKLDALSGRVNQAADFALEKSNALPRGSFVPFNQIQQAGQKAMSNPALAELTAATNTLVNEYSQAVGGGVGTDASREHAREMLNTAQSPEAFAHVIKVLQREVKFAHDAARNVVTHGANGAEPQPTAAPAAGAPAAGAPAAPKRYTYDASGNLVPQ